MVIQRWQTLFLLVACILMCILCASPFAQIAATEAAAAPTPVFVKDAPVFLVLNIVIAILLFIAIFLFKNLKLQMRVTTMSIVLLAASAVTGGFIIYATMPDAEIIWTGAVLLLVLSAIFAACALRFMRKDHRLLRSYDRLR